jgi:hypothetical protein
LCEEIKKTDTFDFQKIDDIAFEAKGRPEFADFTPKLT